MVIKCDSCNADVTPDNILGGTKGQFYEVVNLNGKICLCPDCYVALANFVRSEEFKKVAKEYKKQIEQY